ncbi:MAG: HIT family protein [Rhodobacter sp.]|nr:HIT family protein [Rhodobacter sp.]
MAHCEFCRIAQGTAPAAVAFASARVVAFADRRPIRPGHVQVIPRCHVESFDDLDEDLAAEIILLGQRIARAQKRIYGVRRVGFVFTGNDVPHAHAHLIPLHAADDVTSARYSDPGVPWAGAEDRRETARQLRAALNGLS